MCREWCEKTQTIFFIKKRDKEELIRLSADFVTLSHEHQDMMGGRADSQVVKQIPGIASSLSDSFCACCPKQGGLCIKQTMPGEKKMAKCYFFSTIF